MSPLSFKLMYLFVTILVAGSVGGAGETRVAPDDSAPTQAAPSEVGMPSASETGGVVVEIFPANLTVPYDGEFTLWCQVPADVLPLKVTWFLGDDEIVGDDGRFSRINIKSNKTGSRLSVSGATEDHSGVYTCEVAISTTDIVNATSTVTVEEPTTHAFNCPKAKQNFCENGGTCMYFWTNERDLFCVCPLDFTGNRCQHRDIEDLFFPSTQDTDMKAPLFGAAAGIIIVIAVVAACFVRHYRSKYLKEVQKNQRLDVEEGQKDYCSQESRNVELTPILKRKDNSGDETSCCSVPTKPTS